MTGALALVGMACRYPDSRSPAELWENALARRRAFRRLPAERIRIEDYLAAPDGAPDTTYVTRAAVLEGYEFDRVRFRIGATAFRSADLAHWLALDVAADALDDAGFPEGRELPRESTGVLVGNSLTGEHSRADALRMRFPFVRRVAEAGLEELGLRDGDRAAFIRGLEARYKAPFPPPNEETLAGGLSNTIAGRICNHFDFQGGGYTVDGACASSLLAVTTACSALAAGELDVALAGGVDLSLDPFELVGFARVGALATDAMRVYDARSTGFWPGEGAGFVVLMRLEDARALRKRIYATIRGWGVSSDGSGGLTRPELKGQIVALRRAYARAGFGIDTVGYFEGHGTGTAVGDAVELATLSQARRASSPEAPPAVIGSIKANIGHTKAAAGVAGLIKATMAVHTQILPPPTSCEVPHAELAAPRPALRISAGGEAWPADRPLRAGVSAMGFGGINAHVVLEGSAATRRTGLSASESAALSTQDAEVFLLGARSAGELQSLVDRCASLAPRLSFAELGDLAASLGHGLDRPALRAAVVAADPDELAARLSILSAWLGSGRAQGLEPASGVFLGHGAVEPRIGLLFPGQGSPVYRSGGAMATRFEVARRVYRDHPLPEAADLTSTAAAQPAIACSSLAALQVLEHLGLSASLALGHSLGELAALHWAGVFTTAQLLRIAQRRGRFFAELGAPGGAMAAIEAGVNETRTLLGAGVVIAALNTPAQTVISGEATAVEAAAQAARARGIAARRLRVSHAFHSPGMARAALAFSESLRDEPFASPQRTVFSTVTGALLTPECDLRELLVRQVSSPVRFAEAFAQLSERVDVLLEVGPGHALGAIAGELGRTPAISLDAGGASLRGLLAAVGAAFALGAKVDTRALFSGRLVRAFDLDRALRFSSNPCESVPVFTAPMPVSPRLEASSASEAPPSAGGSASSSPLELVFQLVAERTQLPRSALRAENRLLGDLHLSSIAVSQLVIEATRRLGLPASGAPLEYANASLAEVAQALEELGRQGVAAAPPAPLAGVDAWVRAFRIDWVERSPRPEPAGPRLHLRVLAPAEHPLGRGLVEAFSGPGAVAGVVVCLPPELDEAALSLLLEGARSCRSIEGPSRFVLLHQGIGAAFARTLHLELPGTTTAVIEVPLDHPSAVAWVTAEAVAAAGFLEVRYDRAGARRQPMVRLCPEAAEPGDFPVGHEDVLLVTGGGKGIAAECALALAQKTGARVALLGRSRPETDRELASNLERFTSAGCSVRYLVADVTDAVAVRAAIQEIHRELGPVTGVLHGAGINSPTSLASLDVAAFSRTLNVKVQGLRNVLSAIEPDRLQMVVGFSSIIGRTGMRGEADYAVANEWLSRLVESFAAEHPRCCCRSIEWSVWSGVGMGEKLGMMEGLVRQGITPISPDRGVAMLDRLIRDRAAPSVTIVTGRFGDPPTLELERLALPLLRFLEQPLAHVPGVELIAESELSSDADGCLGDHVVAGEPLFPAVMSLEAMAQVATALQGTSEITSIEEVSFHRPVGMPRGGRLRIQIAALARSRALIEVVLRCESTGFQVDHARARFRFDRGRTELGASPRVGSFPLRRVMLEPATELYGTVLFQQGRFRRLGGYRYLSSTGCVAEIVAPTTTGWFSQFHPAALILGDPAIRDAAMHAIQACVPHETLLPIGLGRLLKGPAPLQGSAILEAQERTCEGDTFVYDVSLSDRHGAIVERWEGLTLKVVRGGAPLAPLPEALLGPYLARRVGELAPGVAIQAAFHHDPQTPRPERSDHAIQHAAGSPVVVRRRRDGKPEVLGASKLEVSVAHAGSSTLAVAGPSPLGCDLEPIAPRPTSVWKELLGLDRFGLAELVARELGEDVSTAATRIWTAIEAARKAGVASDAPLVLASAGSMEGWVQLRAGRLLVLSGVLRPRRSETPLAVAILVGGPDAIV